MPTLASRRASQQARSNCGNRRARSRPRGHYSAFSAHLKKAEAEFRACYLKTIQQAAKESSVETRKTVRTVGEGDDQRTVQEVVEIRRPPMWTAAAWLRERKYPEARWIARRAGARMRTHTGERAFPNKM